MRRELLIRAGGLTLSAAYALFIVWLIASQPASITEAIGGVAAGVGVYAVDQQSVIDGLTYFHADRFAEARAAFQRADPARRDARTQFYIAYSFYREGWHRTHHDDALYKEGLSAVEHAIALAPGGRLIVEDSGLQMHSADELKHELETGLKFEASDLNPARIFEQRK